MCNLVLFFFLPVFHFVFSYLSPFVSPLLWFLFCILGNHSQISRAIVAIRVMDINDNAPEFATEYEAFLCENGKPEQVRKEMAHSSNRWFIFLSLSLLFSFSLVPCNDWPQWIIAGKLQGGSTVLFPHNSPALTQCAWSKGEMRAVRIDQSGS